MNTDSGSKHGLLSHKKCDAKNQGNRIFRERHKYCGESLKGKRAAVAARQFACVTEDDL